jgi:hypothetical protein
MTDHINQLFSLSEAFFIDINIHRKSVLRQGIPINFTAGLKVNDSQLPDHFQVNLKMETIDTSDIKVSMELVGLFKYNGDNLDEDREFIQDYLNNRGLFILFPFMTQMVKINTSMMGMAPINLPLPNTFDLKLEKTAD